MHFKLPPLLEAVTAGNTSAVHKLLASNPSAGDRNLACSAINMAVSRGNFEIVKDLVNHGASLLSANNGGCQGDRLSLAVHSFRFGDQLGRRNGGSETAQIIHLLLEAGVPTEYGDSDTPLHELLTDSEFPAQAEIAADLLSHGAHEKDPVYGSSLAAAASRYDVNSVQAMLRHPDAVHDSLTEAYLAAIYNGESYLYPDPAIRHTHQAGVVAALLDAGADVNARRHDLSYKTETPLTHALDARGRTDKNLDVADVILAHGADVRATGRFGITPVMLVAQDPKRLELILNRGVDVNAQDEDGVTALHLALAKLADSPERLASVALLLKHGADPNLEDKQHSRALNLVLAEDHAVIDLLVAHGAKPSLNDMREDKHDFAIQQKWIYGPLTWALLEEKPYVAESLLRRNQHIDADDCGIAYYAAEVGETALLRQAIALGARLNLKHEGSWDTPLIASAKNGHTDTVAALLDIPGLNINESAYPPPSIRAHEIADGLVMMAINMGGPMIRGETALMLSAENDHADTVKLLLARGARRDLTDSVGRTALDYAKSTSVIELLKSH